MKPRIFSFLKFFIGWPLSIIALFFIIRILGKQGNAAVSQLIHTNPFFLGGAVVSFLVYFFLRSFFWQKLLAFEKYHVPFREVTYLWQLSEIKRFIPGNIWSFVGRATAFATKDVPKKTTAKLLLVEIFYIFLGSFAVSLLSLSLLIKAKIISLSMVFMLALMLIICALFLFTIKKNIKRSVLFKKAKILFTYSAREHVLLFSISTLSFLFFGLGMFLSTLSLFALPMQEIVVITGLFSLAFLAGYGSLITPMGLGVREAVAAWGLGFFISFANASFAALFGRIVSIVAELVFLLLAILFYRIPVMQVLHKSKHYLYEMFLGFFISAYVFYYSLASFLRYKNFYTGRFDLGNMDQTVWNTFHGRLFEFTNPDGTNIISRLSFHADFILIFLSPFYEFWQDPRMLLLIQSVSLGIGALFVYLIAQVLIKKKLVPLLFALVYLLNPSVGYSNLYDFHAVTLATMFFLAAWYFLLKKNYLWYVVFLLLAAITKEQVWIVTAFFGIFTFSKYNKKLGAAITLVSVFFFVFIFFYAIPKAHGGEHFALAYYSDYGSSSSGILKTLLLSPAKTFGILISKARIDYLKSLFSPLGFLSLFSPLVLIFALPDLALNMLSSTPNLHQIYYQYTAVITPFLFIAAIYGYKNIVTKFPKISPVLPFFLFFCSVYAAYIYGPLPWSKSPNIDMFTKPLTYADTIDDFIDFIPARYSIAATNNVGSHLSHRQIIYTIPTGLEQADVVIFLLNDRFAQPSPDAQVQMANKLAHDSAYVELFREQNFVAFARKSLNFQRRLQKERRYFPFIRQLFPRG